MVPMPNLPILEPTQYWECPSCEHRDVTHETTRVVTRMHQCPTHNGIDVPLVQVAAGETLDRSKVRHRVMEREDYIGNEKGVGGIMSVRTERADGSNDTVVFAPVAMGRGEGHSPGG